MLDPLAQEDGYAEYRALVDSQSHPASVPHKNEFAKRLEEVGNTKSNTSQKNCSNSSEMNLIFFLGCNSSSEQIGPSRGQSDQLDNSRRHKLTERSHNYQVKPMPIIIFIYELKIVIDTMDFNMISTM